MVDEATGNGGRSGNNWRKAIWGTAAFLMLLPLVAMQLSDEMNWDETDFIVMGVLIGSIAAAADFIVRKSGSLAYRMGAVVALGTSFLIVWSNLAVGMVGSEDNPFNLLFGGVIAIALIGAVVARFQPRGMAWSLLAAAIANAAVGAAGIAADLRGGVLSMAFAGLWLLGAALFRNAAADRRHAGAAR